MESTRVAHLLKRQENTSKALHTFLKSCRYVKDIYHRYRRVVFGLSVGYAPITGEIPTSWTTWQEDCSPYLVYSADDDVLLVSDTEMGRTYAIYRGVPDSVAQLLSLIERSRLHSSIVEHFAKALEDDHIYIETPQLHYLLAKYHRGWGGDRLLQFSAKMERLVDKINVANTGYNVIVKYSCVSL